MTSTVDAAKQQLFERISALVATERRIDDPPGLEALAPLYFGDVAEEDLADRGERYLATALQSHWRFAADRRPGQPSVRVYAPAASEPSRDSGHTIVEIVTDDMPFIVDSVTMELARHELGIHLVVHPVLRTRRAPDGRLLGFADVGEGTGALDADDGSSCESFVRVEVDRETDTAVLEAVRDDLLRVLGDVRAATGDWLKMLAQLRRVIDALATSPPPVSEIELTESRAFLEWIADHHFTFLGFREYTLETLDGEDAVRSVTGTGLGILHEPEGATAAVDRLSPEGRAKAREKAVLVLTKANSRSTVHRPGYLDYVGVKKFDEHGEVVGEWRFLGLYSSAAYSSSPIDIPLLRRKVVEVTERAGFQRASHSEKDLVAILETYPRDDLFQISVDELFDISMSILQLQERRRVRLFARRDSWGRFVSCLVFVPRDRYTTALRVRVADILSDAFGATGHEFQARVSESVLARLHYVLHTAPDARPDVDVRAIESTIAAATRLWTDDLHDSLVAERGEEEGLELHRRYVDAFPSSYRDDFPASGAAADISFLETLLADPGSGPTGRLSPSAEGRGTDLDFTVFGAGGPLPLSEVMPIVQNMGASVVDEHPYTVTPAGSTIPLWVERFGLRVPPGAAAVTSTVSGAFEDTFAAVLRGAAEDDSLHRLVLTAGIAWPEVAILRAYSRYMRQTGTLFSQSYIADALAAQPHIAALLVDLFRARFDPGRQAVAADECARIDEELNAALDAVTSLDEDRILRALMHLVLATVRTSCYQHADDRADQMSFKLDPTRIPGLPLPTPAFEIFVYSPRVEGVHLRAGKVARGGIRWSDRREDFRTEVLGLMKAQTVKNSVIVPVGAKGGFVVKQPPADREALSAEVVSCYRSFISGLLDVTDNLVAGSVVPPTRVVRYDGDDPYLVVAADKGTATFSDVANEIAVGRRFWLGDAFASGGSAGYDHKKMGITARGAWESLKRHFRELGIDPNADDFTVVGIGDMSGDVFGNGMLLSEHIQLVAAFDHRHVFVDPDPDPEKSFAERRRLFSLPRSSWDDYDRSVLSAGGGIYPRSAKSITLSPEARRRLAIETETLTPTDLIRAVLAAPVDLLWNGGIGTYVKASDESHADVGDKANDPVRVDAGELRCRAVVEGGNLGLTQRARVEYALAGGKVNTDAIDNSAGVDTSDHEVNIKVLLDHAVEAGELTTDGRDRLLAEMTDEIANRVLRDNYRQNQALANAVAQAASMEDVHARYLRVLEREGHLDRRLEALPDDATLAERHNAGQGLTSPELAVLLAYTKNLLEQELLTSDLPSDPDLAGELERYFPNPILERFRHRVPSHPLAREIVSTSLANNVVNRAGISFLFRLAEETGAAPADIVRAHVVASEVLGHHELWRDIGMLDRQVGSATQVFMYLEIRKLVERASRWLLRHRRRPLPIAPTIAAFADGTARIAAALPDLLLGSERERFEARAADLAAQGLPYEMARRVAGLDPLFSSFDIIDVATSAERDVIEVATLYCLVGDRLQLDWLRDRVVDLPRDDRWQALARAALRDDAFNEHRDVVAAVLRCAAPGTDAETAFRTWEARNAAAAERARQVLADVRSHGVFDLATLSVALREVRGLTQAEG